MNSTTFTAVISKEDKPGGWTFVTWPGGVEFLGSGKAQKVRATIGDYEFLVTSLPTGDGTHFLSLNKATLKAIKKNVGDTVTVEVWKLA